MKKLIIILMIFFSFISCESIDQYRRGYKEEIAARESSQKSQNYTTPRYKATSVKHPDLNFSPTDSDSIVIYVKNVKNRQSNHPELERS